MEDKNTVEILQAIRDGIDQLADRILIETAFNQMLALALAKAGALNDEHVAVLRTSLENVPSSSEQFQQISKARVDSLLELVKAHGRRQDRPRKIDG